MAAREGMAADGEPWRRWSEADARRWIAVPGAGDDKYSRGVLGVITGSSRYPGAAVLGVEAASRTGVGMVRYLGAGRPSRLVMQRRPETVTAPGRVQAWLAGSGMDAAGRGSRETARIRSALAEGVPAVLDAGALDLVGEAAGPVIITPHFRELSMALAQAGTDVTPETIAEAPAAWAERAARALGVTVLLKGHVTHIVSPLGSRLTSETGPAWLATAGSGDVLAGILGALLATHAREIAEQPGAVAALAATAALLHGLAAERASAGGPIVALDVAEALPATIAALLARTFG
jgi:Predicted sugar kinase